MKKRWIGYAAWMLTAACLYFFENNTGTRVVLLCSLLLPLIRPLRKAFFSPDESAGAETRETLTTGTFTRREPDEPGDVRSYLPGDPVSRIHWKLSAKKGELLVRKTGTGTATAEQEEKAVIHRDRGSRRNGKKCAALFAAGIPACAILLLVIPAANFGARELCNRLFAASEAVNSYAYVRFAVPENQNVIPAAVLLLCIPALYLAAAAALRSRLMILGMMAACTFFQAYFGLPFPAWINIPLYALFAVLLLRRPAARRDLASCGIFILAAALAVILFLPGVDAATETASERVRDRLAQAAEQITGIVPEVPDGERETRHIHTRSMENGNREAETEQEFRLVTVEEEQISMPHWVNRLKMILLILLAAAIVTLPFTPFLLLNARQRRAQEIREAFGSENAGEGINAVFRQVIRWLEAFHGGAENLLYRDWTGLLPDAMPEGYADRFSRCAADFEEAAYSGHVMPEQKRRNALDLLKETEESLWKAANRKQRLYLKYWMCLHE